MFISQQSSFTSGPFQKLDGNPRLFASGAGTLRIERRDQSGEWKQFPELTFTSPTAQDLELRGDELRVVVLTGPIDVELK